ncbi:hypothetical protein [Mycobacterium sp. 050134]|uniref:hypothetical protein n=1 Tax=Mycobacterium sp. 050134 TaxID=3096111 RepID=UPI002ED7789B
MNKSNTFSGGGIGALLGLAVLIWIMIELIWWIAAAAALVVLFLLARAIVGEVLRRAGPWAVHRAAVGVRADRQHSWVVRGGDRGVYGSEGAELMHYLYPAGGQVRRLNLRR